MKKQHILISLIAIMSLVGCTNSNNGKSSVPADLSSNEGDPSSEPAPEVDESKFVIENFGTAKFEAEKFNVKEWIPDDLYAGDSIIEEAKASGGAYLAAAKPKSDAVATFSFEIKAYSKVTMSVAFAQTEEWLESALEIDKTYVFEVGAIESFAFAEGKNVLKARSSETTWELMPYVERELYAGVYDVSLRVLENTPKGCPSIDYIQFKTVDATYVPVDPSTITEDDIPDNDMRNLQQYKYVLEEDVYKYKTYATGADLSAPRGMKLRFEDVDNASKYYVQVSEDNSFADAVVRESTTKYYMFQNAKLDTKYYYRAATSEAGLATADVKEITSTAQAPRVVSVPEVLNFRDIGGWESTLVAGAKVNQGLYFRCAQLDAASGSTKSCLDNDGKGLAALKELGIKCDIDMRDQRNQPNTGKGPSKANTADWPITFVSAPVPSGSESDRWEGSDGTWMGTKCNIAEQYVKIFNAIANCDNEPVMLHCTYGADRTGIVTFFLESLLGMELEDMIKDYLWTQFTQGRNVQIGEGAEFPQWVSKTEGCEGSTFADKMENHLISFGIEKAKLEHIREIFIPGYVAQD